MLGGGPEQAALFFWNCRIEISKNAKSQYGHVELKIMIKHMKLMTYMMELLMCVRDVIFVPH